MSDKEFEDLINGVNQPKAKQVFRGTGMPGKQSLDMIRASNKEAYKQEVGKFGIELAKWAKQENSNDLTKSKEQILEDLRREGKIQ